MNSPQPIQNDTVPPFRFMAIHANPVPHGDRVLRDALRLLAQVGRDAQRILDVTQAEEMSR